MSAGVFTLERQTVLAPLGLSFRDAVTGEAVGDGLNVVAYPSANPAARTRAFPNRSGAYVLHDAAGMRDVTRGAGDDAFWAGAGASKRSFTVEVWDERRRYLPCKFGVELPVRGLLRWVWPLAGGDPATLAEPSDSFRDDFDDNARDAAKWKAGTMVAPLPGSWDEQVTAVERQGRLEVTPRASRAGAHYNGYLSTSTWGATDARARVEVPQVTKGAAETVFTLARDATNWVRFVAQAGQLLFKTKVGSSETSVAYDATAQRWWSLRHDRASDELSFETSPDGRAWTRRRVVARPFPLTAITVELGAGSSASVADPGAAFFDNFTLESNPKPYVPLFSAPERVPPGGMAVLRAELWNPLARGGKGAPASYALVEARVAGAPTLRGLADASGRVALVFPTPAPTGEPDGQGGTQPPPAFTSQKWDVGLRAFYAPVGEAPPLPDLRAVFRQPLANLWSDEARSVPLTRATLRFGQELVVRSSRPRAGTPLEPTPLPVLLITPAT
jgi:hypothetical protein